MADRVGDVAAWIKACAWSRLVPGCDVVIVFSTVVRAWLDHGRRREQHGLAPCRNKGRIHDAPAPGRTRPGLHPGACRLYAIRDRYEHSSFAIRRCCPRAGRRHLPHESRSEEHTSELQSLMRISYAVFCLKKKTYN